LTAPVLSVKIVQPKQFMPNRRSLTIVVNGVPTDIEVNENAPLHTVIEPALHKSGNTSRPPQDWELKDSQGNLLPPEQKIEDFHFPSDAKVFLSLKAGIGGIICHNS
jgi:hypothetical protein